MADIFTSFLDLPSEVFPFIFSYLEMEDMIALALTCGIFRQICLNANVFRKLDLSSCVLSTSQRCVLNSFFEDGQLTGNIGELNISNLRSFNWQMDDELQKFIKSICPHLEALHVINCGVSLQTLHSILQEAPRLTSLSWSIWDFTSEDIEFLLKTMKSSEGVCLKNIKHLHLQMNETLQQVQIAKYLVLSCCKYLEELEIYTWSPDESHHICLYSPVECYRPAQNQIIPGFPEPSVQNALHHLHSLMVVPVGDYAWYIPIYSAKLSDFVVSVVSRKSSSTNWKKFCILPSTGFSREHFSLLLHQDDFHSLEAFGVIANKIMYDALDEMKTFFRRISDNTVRRMQLRLPDLTDSIVELCEPISRVGGHSLKVLTLSSRCFVSTHDEQNAFIHTLFSNCSNITELDLIHCCFERDICEPLSQLKHLTKVQLSDFAVSSKYSSEDQAEISNADLLAFVENCKEITHLDVRGCYQFLSCRLTYDLLVLAKLRNLKSLTLYNMSGITEWTFLKNMSENCKFLTTLRIKDREHFNSCHIPILMESSRFLKHLAINVEVPLLESEVFWNLLKQAKNLERLCIIGYEDESLNIPVVVAVETLKSLPRLHVLHLHSDVENDDGDFYDQMIRMLEQKESDCRFSLEIVVGRRMNTWINHPTGYTLISNKLLPLNFVELCDMEPILDIPSS